MDQGLLNCDKLTGKEEVTIWSATVIDLARFEEQDCSNRSEAVGLIRRRLFRSCSHPNQ